MARAPKFIPRYDKSRGQWVVNIPAKMSSTGKRERVYFDRGKEEDAIEHGRRLRVGKESLKERAKGIKTELMEAAVKWEELAVEYGYRGLDHFCAEALAKIEAGGASPTLLELITGHEEDNSKNWSNDYKSKRWAPFRKRMAPMEAQRISALNEEWWRAWFKDWVKEKLPGIDLHNDTLGMIRSLFERSAAKKFYPVNPLDVIVAVKDRGGRGKPVSEPDDVQKLLMAAWEHDREMVPYFATCYFAGPRPDSEAMRIKFEHYDWGEKLLKLNVTKTLKFPTRWVPMEDALMEWMRPWKHRKGSIIPANFRKRRERLIYGYHTTPGADKQDKKSWVQLVPTGHDITRHSYGSYWEAVHRGEAGCMEAVVANMGHENYKTFKTYYLNARPRSQAAAYWAIRPPAGESNIIAIA